MTPTRWIVFAVIAVVTLGGLVALSSKDKLDVSKVDINTVVTTGDYADRVIGNAASKVVLVEYADFQCGGCAAVAPSLKAIAETYKDQIAFVYRYFPLTTIHPNALISASAAEAAGLQGKFWEMHDLLFQNQTSWERLKAEQRGTTFEDYATQLGLNIDQFRIDIASKKVAAKIIYDRTIGGKAGVDATPTLFLNGTKVSESVVSDVSRNQGTLLKDSLNTAIKATGGTIPAAKAQ